MESWEEPHSWKGPPATHCCLGQPTPLVGGSAQSGVGGSQTAWEEQGAPALVFPPPDVLGSKQTQQLHVSRVTNWLYKKLTLLVPQGPRWKSPVVWMAIPMEHLGGKE